ncbi:YqjF family protein [Salinicoccus hispanicus]|uniref:DUF2071 domain-containing protein n=1 Tax=Salinicoccus hispanicus TaxID=157225 RepID=A0A6N8TXM2_9STAP|nr:DUF2071 domain-containing protein [Salinicoccus hispanicus]MXQ50480.1 DUF2071 domain-containing protein [Salinicoccus hispanicus]
MKQELLKYTEGRNAPLPEGPWSMYQRWEDLMCMHIPVEPEVLLPHVPDELELDIYDGSAWISIFSFNVRNMQLRGMPRFPYVHEFLELNVRTYVRYQNIPGIYFFSLDAAKVIPVIGARLGSLPYFKAGMKAAKRNEWTHFSSHRQHGVPAYFKGKYKSVSEPEKPLLGTLDYWLLERYYLFNTIKGAVVHIGIHHLPWKPAYSSVHYENGGINSLLPGDIEGEPVLAHYIEALDVIFWPVKQSDQP